MRLLVLADASSVHSIRWVEAMAGLGHRVMLASLEAPLETTVPVSRLRGFGGSRWLDYLAAATSARRLINDYGPDLVNAHFVPNYGLLGALSGFSPLAVSAWGSDLLVSARRSPLHRARARLALGRAGLVTCDGQVLVEELLKLGVERGRIMNVPMGVDRALIADRRGGLPPRGRIGIISTRSLEAVYNVETLLRAMPLVSQGSRRLVRLTIVGDGSLRDRLEQLARGLGTEVEFTGRLGQEELVRRLDASDIYVSASLSDSTSVSLLEAMARGLVPVVSGIAGNREWVEDGRNGFLFRPGDLAVKILSAMHSDIDIASLRESNLRLVETRGCRQAAMAEVERAFLSLAGRGR